MAVGPRAAVPVTQIPPQWRYSVNDANGPTRPDLVHPHPVPDDGTHGLNRQVYSARSAESIHPQATNEAFADAPLVTVCVFPHCGEYFQGVIEAANGSIRRCLITQMASGFHCRVELYRTIHPTLVCVPAERTKALRAAELTSVALSGDHADTAGLLLRIRSDVPVGLGAGSSSSDCLAASRAIQKYHRRRLSPEAEYRICVAAENATDPIMFDRCVLAAQREGRAIADLGPLPHLIAVTFDSDPLGRGVDTDRHPRARYNRDEIERLRTLLARLTLAVRTGDLEAIGLVSAQSAAINQRHLQNSAYWYLQNAPARLGSVGFSVAHSGTAASLLFDPSDRATPAAVDQCLTELRRMGYRRTWVHQTAPPDDHDDANCPLSSTNYRGDVA